jgi:hypothetical protein
VTGPMKKVEFYPERSGVSFVAAVLLTRVSRTIDRDPGYEGFDLKEYPNVTWWRHHVVFAPDQVIRGEWDLDEQISLKTRGAIAGARNRRVLAILARNPRGKLYWVHEFIAQRERLYSNSPRPEELGSEHEAEKIVDDYLRRAHLAR